MFFLRCDERILIGSSPEILVRLENGRIDLRPIAGTRPQGRDSRSGPGPRTRDLLDDPKERAEHLMLVDLGRNDVGRVAEIGSVQVTDYAIIERYSHVMHIVSNVEGRLREGVDWLDVLRAAFPAGTLSGAPKIRAMEIIDELEHLRRGPYGGCVGYVDHTGNMDMAIAIRTMLVQNDSDLPSGRRRDRRGFEARSRIPGVPEQSPGPRTRHRSGAGGRRLIRILMIDNYDSFTYNLVQYLGELGASVSVLRNDAEPLERMLDRPVDGVVISPGPGRPEQSGVSLDAVRAFGERGTPLLGVCLGHQSIGQAYGGEIVRAERLMHGKTSAVSHDGQGLFAGLPEPFEATRYHSLIVRPDSVPAALEVCAHSDDGEVMGLRHREFPIAGVQFHPESVMTGAGKDLLSNFLKSCESAS